MISNPIYIKSIELTNIRTFGAKEILNLEKKDGTITQWTLILGDNGIGKSTLLQCIAWMKPYLPYDEDKHSKKKRAKVEPNLNNEENETLFNLVKRTKANHEIAQIHAVFVAKRKLNIKPGKQKQKTCGTKMTIELVNGNLDVVTPSFRTNTDVFYNDEIVIFAYSASRRLGKLNIKNPALDDTIPSFISEKTELFDAEDILHTANYAALGAKGKKKKDYEDYIKRIKEMLVSILPDVENMKDVEISPPKIINENERQGNVIITTRHGTKLPFKNASLGYRTTISWTIDLAWRLFKEYPTSSNPLAEPAIVLIDEIDLHLHPVWQRQIMQNLSDHFPNVQFIATAHSPLMVQAARGSNYAVLKQSDEGVQILNELTAIDGWRVDQILTSEFFGLQSSRGQAYEELLNKRALLLKKKQLTRSEKNSLKKLEEELLLLPIGESTEEINNRKLVSTFVADVKKHKLKIKI